MVQAAKISITGTQRMEGVEPETLGLVTEGSYCYEPGARHRLLRRVGDDRA